MKYKTKTRIVHDHVDLAEGTEVDGSFFGNSLARHIEMDRLLAIPEKQTQPTIAPNQSKKETKQ